VEADQDSCRVSHVRVTWNACGGGVAVAAAVAVAVVVEFQQKCADVTAAHCSLSALVAMSMDWAENVLGQRKDPYRQQKVMAEVRGGESVVRAPVTDAAVVAASAVEEEGWPYH